MGSINIFHLINLIEYVYLFNNVMTNVNDNPVIIALVLLIITPILILVSKYKKNINRYYDLKSQFDKEEPMHCPIKMFQNRMEIIDVIIKRRC